MDEILIARESAVTILTLNRPDRHNAISRELSEAMSAAVADFGEDPEQRVMIITGAGDRAFCSGADLGRLHHQDPKAKRRQLPVSSGPDMRGIAACEKPVIAAINGLAVGGGLEISLCCDIRLASETAWFALPEVKHGFLAGLAAVVLPRMMPMGAVLDMMLCGERMSAEDAYRLGLVQKVLPPERLMEEALRKAHILAGMSQPALWATKRTVRFWRDMMLAEHHRYYEAMIHRVLLTGDMFEGLKAFNERRTPEFSGGWPDPYELRDRQS